MTTVSQQEHRYVRHQKPDVDEQPVLGLRSHVLECGCICIGDVEVGCRRRWREQR